MPKKVGKTVLSNVTEGINKQMTKESLAANLGGGAEAESFSKTLTQIHMTVQPKQLFGSHSSRWLYLKLGILDFFSLASSQETQRPLS